MEPFAPLKKPFHGPAPCMDRGCPSAQVRGPEHPRVRAVWKRLLVALVVCLWPLAGSAQRVTLRVVDAITGAGIPEAVWVLSGEGRRETSDAGGWIQIDFFHAGVQEGYLRAAGYSGRLVRLEVGPDIPAQRLDVFLSPVIHELPPLEVQGELSDEDRAILASREAVSPTDEISGEALKDITSDGVADSLEKIAGVSVSSEEGSVSGISIRGAGARQTRVTLDGQSMAGGGGRGTTRGAQAMNQVPREFLQKVQVMKAPTPDMDADAIGGTVDLQTSRVAQAKNPRSSIAWRSAWQEDPGVWGHRLNLTHAQPIQLGESGRRLGLLLAVSGQQNESGGDDLRVLNQWPLRPSPETGDLIRTLARLRTGTRLVSREGAGAMVNLDFEWNRTSRLYFKALIDQSSQTLGSEFLSLDFIRGNLLSLTPESGHFQRMSLEKQFLERRSEDQSGSLVLAAEQLLGDWELEESIGYSFATSDSDDSQNATFSTPRVFEGGYNLADSPATPDVFLSSGGSSLSPEDLMDAGEYWLDRYDLIDNRSEDAELALRFNLGRRWETGEARWIFKSGLKSRLREAEQNQDKDRFLDDQAVPLTVAAMAGPATAFNGLYPVGPSWNAGVLSQFFQDNPGAFRLDATNSVLDSLASDFAVSEAIHSAYLMAQRETDRWVLIAGLRFERTDFETEGYETITRRDPDGQSRLEIRPLSLSDAYDKWFPGFHALHRFNRNWVGRISLTRTLQRPDFRDLSPSSRVNLDSKRIRSGNPDLRPFDAKALDLGTDFEMGGWGAVSLGVFLKRIDDFIVDVEEETDYLGESGFIRSHPINGSPADLVGIEAAWNVSLSFLPAPLENTRLALNYTYTDSTAAYPGHPGTTVMLPEQVRDIFNASLRWQEGRWSLTLRTRYHGLRLNQLVTPGQDQFNDAFWSHSIGLNYKWNDTVSFSLGLANLNQPDRISYQGNPGQLVYHRVDSRSFSIGLNLRFSNGVLARPSPAAKSPGA